MSDDTPSPLNNVITIDDERIKSHLDRVVRGTVEEALNALLDTEADRLFIPDPIVVQHQACPFQRSDRGITSGTYIRITLSHANGGMTDFSRTRLVEPIRAGKNLVIRPCNLLDSCGRIRRARSDLGGRGSIQPANST
jgi:hypothetical protein